MRRNEDDENDEAMYVCLRVTDMPVPYVPCLRGICSRCKEEVFYSKYVYENDAFVKTIIDSGNLICMQCATGTLEKAGG